MMLQARPGGPLTGCARVPGDKSISHRALILGALAAGMTEIEGLLEGQDVLNTAKAMAAFGAGVERLGEGRWRLAGRGGFSEPADVIDCGNSGTGVRLIMGAAAGFDLAATFTGDQSLRGRPMNRIIRPLSAMGAQVLGHSGGKLPLTLKGGGLKGLSYRLPEPSAQVKSAVLLAGLHADGPVEVIEPERTRDHTERMLRAFGVDVDVRDAGGERAITIGPGQKLAGAKIVVPGDPSSAAFLIVAALIVPGSDLRIENVLLNEHRTGLFLTLREMGADLRIENVRTIGGEEVGDIAVRYGPLKGVGVPAARAPSMIDEYPILAVAAAAAEGKTVMRGLKELMVKESDRLALTVAGLRACGVGAEQEGDTMIVNGVSRANHPIAGGALVHTHGDHRIAMAHLVLGLSAEQPIRVDEPDMIATSFPGFAALMGSIGADIAQA
jgi:3-phosphoshikimate 1-carboxyvinyltransferase